MPTVNCFRGRTGQVALKLSIRMVRTETKVRRSTYDKLSCTLNSRGFVRRNSLLVTKLTGMIPTGTGILCSVISIATLLALPASSQICYLNVKIRRLDKLDATKALVCASLSCCDLRGSWGSRPSLRGGLIFQFTLGSSCICGTQIIKG